MDATLPDLRSLDVDALEALAVDMGEPRFRGRQLFKWIHEKGAESFEAMTDLPAAFRERLEAGATLGTLVEVRRQLATDETIKCLFRLPSGRLVESVLIPDVNDDGSAKRLTVCVSSQVGCAMACSFCATGLMGFQENLTPGQIAEQVYALDRIANERWGRGVTNVVFMGMGEPFQNYAAVTESLSLLTTGLGLSPKRITVSTVGLARRIRQFADDVAAGTVPGAGLAISLHAPTDPQRSAIMPVNRSEKTDLKALGQAVRHYYATTGKPVTYEYCLFSGVNDTVEDAFNLSRIASWAPCKVNLIMYNPVEGTDFSSSNEEALDAFIATLVRRKVRVTVRRSRGQDIDAACGQLAVAEGA
ncbi:23S rRNA (adenine(2503)-C(2))-methyltransferase RlmN [Rubrivirga sp. IMCC45206]|uniref:23S rRNA (adenine(2503)-C(2))-methyltransferase RlmN n=1 Tax=Rubrivirga sp. IMCC45206 TaxID=3391614 RepID=UPI0039901E02